MRRAFSLVELSIVLVILGLLVGGILAGKSLIRASELRSVGNQYTSYLIATRAFRDKYFALPGDLRNAQSFWGTDPDGCPPGTPTYTARTTTCNGNGDNYISNPAETHRVWQHLANAGLIEGQFSGQVGSGGTYEAHPGENAPAGKLSGSVWGAFADVAISGDGSYFDNPVNPHTTLFFGGFTAANVPVGKILKPEEAWNIDTKIDDGKPGTGAMIVYRWGQCGNASSSADFAADYKLTDNTLQCALMFNKIFQWN